MAEKETKIQIIVSFHSNPMRNRKFQTNSKKFQKIIKYYYGFISSQNRTVNDEKGRKQKLSLRSILIRRIIENFKKNSKKIEKYHSGFISSQNRLESAEKERK